MTLLDAKEFDEGKSRKAKRRIVLALVIVLVLGGLAWWFRYWPEQHVAENFFAALQNQSFETAYGVWMNDPQWKQHPQKYAKYPFNEFYTDWGPGSEWGTIKTYKIYAVGAPPKGGTGVIVDVTVNDRVERARVWVEKSDKTMSFSPY